jgi:hypothetical protein
MFATARCMITRVSLEAGATGSVGLDSSGGTLYRGLPMFVNLSSSPRE